MPAACVFLSPSVSPKTDKIAEYLGDRVQPARYAGEKLQRKNVQKNLVYPIDLVRTRGHMRFLEEAREPPQRAKSQN